MSLKVMKQLAAHAPNLQSLTMDLSGTAPKMPMEKIILECPSLHTLKVSGLATDNFGIAFLSGLCQQDNIRTLELSFGRLVDA